MTQPTKPKPAPRKRTPAKPRAAAPKASAPAAPPAAAPLRPRRHLHALAAFALVLGAAAAAPVLLLRGDDANPQAESAAAVSPGELATRAGELGLPVYWAGAVPGRTLELTSSSTGTFVRYLPAGAPVGGEDRTLTIATYPMPDAYATATRRAKGAGMTSAEAPNGGLAVWSKSQPTSVYVAWRGVPSLIEVYAPRAADARATALSPRLRPAR